jgi:membrane associated rhomboid family serine protease
VSLYGLLVDENLVYALAVVPRRFDGLAGVLGAPLVHGSFAHLAANTVPLLILGGLVAVRGVGYYVSATLAIAVLGGLGLWVFGRSAAHVGASGLIFGYFGLLVARGYYERSLQSIAASVVVVVVYGGMIAGVLPRDDQVSWEGHLFGLLAGGLCARAALGRTR